jgi:hypothetical protein
MLGFRGLALVLLYILSVFLGAPYTFYKFFLLIKINGMPNSITDYEQ